MIRGELLELGAELCLPPAGKGKQQMVASDVFKTKTVANARIHVERAIERLKRYKILSNQLEFLYVEIFDDIISTCAALCNRHPALVK